MNSRLLKSIQMTRDSFDAPFYCYRPPLSERFLIDYIDL